MSRVSAAAAVVLGAALISGCQTLSDGWNRVFGTVQVTRKPAELVAIQPTVGLRVLWQGRVGEAGKDVYFPARSGTVIYAAGASGEVTGFDVERGTVVARIAAGQRITGGVGVGDGLLLLGTPRGEVLAFDREGKSLWKAQLSGEVLAPPQAQEGTVVARAGGGRVYGLDAVTGKQKWLYQRTTPALSVRSHAGVVVERGAVFAGFSGGRLVGLGLANGNVGWEAVVALPRGATELERVADVTSLPVVDGATVCAAAYQGRIACFDATRGTQIWARDVSSIAGLDVDDRGVYVTDDRSAVLAYEKGGGASLWRQDKLADRRVTAPLALGRYVVVGDLEGYVHLLTREEGAFAARLPTDGSAISAPPLALDRSTFVVQTRNGGVFAITTVQ